MTFSIKYGLFQDELDQRLQSMGDQETSSCNDDLVKV